MFVDLSNSTEKAIIDDEDYTLIKKYIWFIQKRDRSSYVLASMNNGCRKNILMHRFIMGVDNESWKKVQVDHINHNGLDCRKENLRVCSHTENQRNATKRKALSSKYKGVCWGKRTNNFEAYIWLDHKKINLGFYTEEEEAARAYDINAIFLFKEYAHTNFDMQNYSWFVDSDSKEKDIHRNVMRTLSGYKRVKISKYTGVTKKGEHYISYIHTNFKKYHIGCFKTEIEAAQKFDECAIFSGKSNSILNFDRTNYPETINPNSIPVKLRSLKCSE